MVLRKTSLHRRRSIKGQRCLQLQYYQNRSHIEIFFYKRPNPCSSLGGLRMTTRRHFFIVSMEWRETKRGHVSTISTPALTSLTPRVSPGKLWASVAKIWLFGPHSACSFIHPKLFASSISTSSRSFVLLRN